MSKEILLRSAEMLNQPSKEAKEEFSQKMNLLIETMNKTMLNRSDIKCLVGEDNINMMEDNHANHARFMESIFENYIPEILVDTVLWVFRAYRSRNFTSTYWAAQINTWIKIYSKELTEKTYEEIHPYYKWMQVNIPIFNKLAEEDIDAPLSSH